MTVRPILMSAPMVRAIIDGSKTQTRRVASKLVRHPDLGNLYTPGALVLEGEPQHVIERACPYGRPGDRLWVREAWAPHPQDPCTVFYRATVEAETGFPVWSGPWRPSIHMPRRASRITLEITGVRVERLQDISEVDARAEGIDYDPGEGGVFHVRSLAGCCSDTAAGSYRKLWEQINGPESWASNPWVWAVDFRRIAP